MQAHGASSVPASPLPARASTSGSAASLTSSECAQTTCATSSSDGTVTSTRSRLRNDLISASLVLVRDDDERQRLAPRLDERLRLLRGRRLEHRTVDERDRPVAAWCESAPARAARRAFRFTLTSKLRVPGGKTTPPPVNCGARIVPWRARGRCPSGATAWRGRPETRPRLLAPRVPARRAFSSARTASCTRCGLQLGAEDGVLGA